MIPAETNTGNCLEIAQTSKIHAELQKIMLREIQICLNSFFF